MRRRCIGAIVVGCLLLGVAACGGGSEPPSKDRERVACLNRAGATADLVKVESTHYLVRAATPDGNFIFIFDLPEPDLAEPVTSALKRKIHMAGVGGILTSRTVDDKSALVMVVGRKGAEGGAPSATSEAVARECAIRPRDAMRGHAGDLL